MPPPLPVLDQLPARPRSSKQEQKRDKKMAIHIVEVIWCNDDLIDRARGTYIGTGV
jgi:hypothetical protein